MKHLLALMAFLLVLMLVVSGVMAVGNGKQSEQMARRTQQISDLRAELRAAEQQQRTLTRELTALTSRNATLRAEKTAISRRLAETLRLADGLPEDPADLRPAFAATGGVSAGNGPSAGKPSAAERALYTARVQVSGSVLPPQGEELLQLTALGNVILRMGRAAEVEAAVEERDSAVSERDAAVAERDVAVVERDTAISDRDAAVAERDTAISERDVAVTERDDAITERDVAVAERDTAISERDAAVAERDTAISERDVAVAERDNAISERDVAVTERDSAISERDIAVAEQNNAISERDAAVAERDTAISERDAAITERYTAISERNAAVTERDTANHSAICSDCAPVLARLHATFRTGSIMRRTANTLGQSLAAAVRQYLTHRPDAVTSAPASMIRPDHRPPTAPAVTPAPIPVVTPCPEPQLPLTPALLQDRLLPAFSGSGSPLTAALPALRQEAEDALARLRRLLQPLYDRFSDLSEKLLRYRPLP